MLCRAVLTVAAVSYLICVLILSGLQKEDLDVNMLQKLQRHGLDINDMNNERLRGECLRGVNATEKAESTKSEIQTTNTITENTLNAEINQQQNKWSVDGSNKSIIESFLKYFLDLQKSHNTTKQKKVDERTKSVVYENYNIPQSSNLKYIFSDTLGYNSAPIKKIVIQPPTTEGVFHLFSQNILQLWNTYNKDTKEITTSSRPITYQTSTPKPIEKSTNNYDQDMQYVQKFFADYISKNPISTTTSLPSTREFDIDRISDVIRRFIANAKSDSQMNSNRTAQVIDNSIDKKSNDAHIDEKRNYFLTYTEANVKNGTSLPYQTEKLFNVSSSALFDNHKLFIDDKHINTVNNLYSNMQKGNNKKIESKKTLPNDLIKELAESVKELVLRDIKKEISTILPKTNPPTAEIPSTTTSKVENGQTSEPNVAIEKIMELFQQIKSIKEKTIIAGNSKIKVTEKKDIHHEYKGPAKVIYSYKPGISPYGIKSPTEQIAPVFVKQHNRDPNIIPNYNQPPVIQNPVYQVHQIDNFDAKDGLRLAPITIQTNSFEIAPLNIPILKPLGMVNQNIIVTTESPNRRPRLDTHHSNYIRHIDRYKVDDFRSRNDWHTPSPSSERLYNSHRHDYDAPKVDHNNGYKRDHFKPHFTKSDYDRMRLRNQEMKRFHERLEKYDEPNSSEDREDCCKLKVASRQQLPLSEAKKRSRFDDIHFRNFLKTQQKVNDMLEKILATKTKSDGPRSVETT